MNKNTSRLLIGLGVIVLVGIIAWRIKSPESHMKVTSTAFKDGQRIPIRYTCDGASDVPPISIRDVPRDAKTLALTVVDPDAPVAGGFIHWVIFDINPSTVGALNGDATNKPSLSATDGANGTGKTGYVGPCPPSGTHHYFFTVYALNTTLGLKSGASLESVTQAMEGHIMDQASIVGLYSRK